MAAGTTRNASGSKTMADLMSRAAEQYADHAMVRHKTDGAWHDVSFPDAAAIVREIGLGIVDLGIAAGDRVAILATTRPEWTYCDLAISSAGCVVVPIYPTNSPEECEYVLADSDAVAIVCEDAEQLEKLAAVRDRLPALRHVISIDAEPGGHPQQAPGRAAVSLDELRASGRESDPGELRSRQDAVTLDDPFTIIYTSGTTGPPKGCVLTHGNYRAMVDMCVAGRVMEANEVMYLFLPLAHSFALLAQLLSIDQGGTIAYATGDTNQIVAEIGETKPTYLPSVPRIFEKIHALAQKMLPVEEIDLLRTVGGRIHDLQATGEEVPAELLAQFEPVAAKAEFVRNVFGGRLRKAVSGAAPIAPEILEFFWGAGVPVLEGYGLTEAATGVTCSSVEHHRFGSVGHPFPGVELRIADDGEILVKGGNVFAGYHKRSDESFGMAVDGWLQTGDLGSIDEDGFLWITGRKKDIIITAGGKNITPANFENDLKQTRWVSQCVMHGDRRPYPVALVTLDEEEILPWASEQGIEDASTETLASNERVRALVQIEIDRINERYANVEQVKRFAILERDFTQESGELTPSLKVKRTVVYERHRAVLDALYDG